MAHTMHPAARKRASMEVLLQEGARPVGWWDHANRSEPERAPDRLRTSSEDASPRSFSKEKNHQLRTSFRRRTRWRTGKLTNAYSSRRRSEDESGLAQRGGQDRQQQRLRRNPLCYAPRRYRREGPCIATAGGQNRDRRLVGGGIIVFRPVLDRKSVV